MLRIRELMEERGIQGTQLADAMHVSPKAVSKWVNGCAYPSSDKLPALANALGCSIDALYTKGPFMSEVEGELS